MHMKQFTPNDQNDWAWEVTRPQTEKWGRGQGHKWGVGQGASSEYSV